MTKPVNNRWPFKNRPWITGKLYDDYSRASILHCDAYVMERRELMYLILDWREGGKRQAALDGYLIESDGLTPIWDVPTFAGAPVIWSRGNHAWMSRVHATVMQQPERMMALGRGAWARVVVQAHYIDARERDAEIHANAYTERKPYAPRQNRALPDIL